MKRSGFADHVADLLEGFGPVSARRMFGGYGLFHEGLMMGLIASDVLYFKVDERSRSAYEEAGSRPFSYERKTQAKPAQLSYWEVPADLLEDPDGLADWAREAYAAALRVRKSAKKRKSRHHAGSASGARLRARRPTLESGS